jgi:hypothetical protein
MAHLRILSTVANSQSITCEKTFYLSHALILSSNQMHAASETFDFSAPAENGERSANDMNYNDWAMQVIALANLILRVWEMRKPRRSNDEADPQDH